MRVVVTVGVYLGERPEELREEEEEEAGVLQLPFPPPLPPVAARPTALPTAVFRLLLLLGLLEALLQWASLLPLLDQRREAVDLRVDESHPHLVVRLVLLLPLLFLNLLARLLV